MENKPVEVIGRTTRLHGSMEAMETLRKVRDFPNNPVSMAYFYTFLEQFYTAEILPNKEKQIIGTLCVQVPDELIYAVGAQPLRMCSGTYNYDQIGADRMPAKSCPLVRATTGMLSLLSNDMRKRLQGLVIPTTCDQKKKMAEQLEGNGIAIYSLEMPSSKESNIARFYWQESVKQFALDVEKMSGKKLRRRNVKEAIGKKIRACQLYRKLMELRNAAQPVIFGKDVLLVTNSFFLDDLDNWIRAATALVSEIEERTFSNVSVCSSNVPRILLTGSPSIFPNIKIPLLVEQSGGIIVTDEVCSSSRLLYDAVAYDEENLGDMIPAIADRYLKPCTCPCLSPNTDRKRKIAELVVKNRIDGVVYQAFSGCLPYEMEQNQIASMLEKTGTPMLYLETDYSPEDQGQLSTRIEAFIESITMRRRRPRKRVAIPTEDQ
jgi:benzoyl-CoA reductase/2-hydroxyglutaryl-CoA dehydratase subunit BcrC/BadD/HgdB